MILSVALILGGLLLLVVGGEALLRGAVGLATIARLTPAVIGLTVVAAGTSVPELAVSGVAAYRGNSEISVANVVGSNIFNIAAILGLCAAIRPLAITGNTIKLEYPVLALVTLLCLVVVQDGVVNRLDAALLLAVYVGFTAYLVSLVRQQMSVAEAREMKAEVQELEPEQLPVRPLVCFGFLAAGIALLAGGAELTVRGATDLARMIGWSDRLIGLTIVSVGTSLPEVVASLVSMYRGRTDIAIGNVIGSNLFNILGILGICGLIAPLPVQAVIFQSDCMWMLGITLLLFPIMFTGLRIARWEGAILLAVYGVYVWTLLNASD